MIRNEYNEFKLLVARVSEVIASLPDWKKEVFRAEIKRFKEDEETIRKSTSRKISRIP
jgi:hypothetical protein